MRIGIGYDVHRLVKDRDLIIGGIKIPHYMGLLGHSDADVLIHAIMDSMLGAMSLGDIGKFFPDTDNKYKDISSIELLKKVVAMITEKGFKIENLDTNILAEKPKFRPYIDQMIKVISDTCLINVNCVNVSATTEEKLGFTGSEEGIAAQAIILLSKI